MSEEPKQQQQEPPKATNTNEPTVEELQSRVRRYEEDLAWQRRELETLRELKKTVDADRNKKAEGGDPEAIKAVKEDYQRQLADLEERYKKEITQKDQLIRQETIVKKGLSVAMQQFNDAPAVKEWLENKLSSVCDLQDGKVIIKDKDGQPRYSEVNKRELMGLDEYISELAAANPALVKPSTPAGTVKPGATTHYKESGITFEQYVRMSPQEQRNVKLSPEQARAFTAKLLGK